MSVSINIDKKGTAEKDLKALKKKLTGKGMKRLWKEVWFFVMSKSIAMNFKRGGRPLKWEKSQRAISQGGVTLSDKGRLRNSIVFRLIKRGIAVGTNVQYAGVHQNGFSGTVGVSAHKRTIKSAFGRKLKNPVTFGVKAHSRQANIPKRPFLLVQASDKKAIKKRLRTFLRAKAV